MVQLSSTTSSHKLDNNIMERREIDSCVMLKAVPPIRKIRDGAIYHLVNVEDRMDK